MLQDSDIDSVIKKAIGCLRKENPSFPKDGWQDVYQQAWLETVENPELTQKTPGYLMFVISKRMRGWIKKLKNPLSAPDNKQGRKKFKVPAVVDFNSLHTHHSTSLPVDDQVIVRDALDKLPIEYQDALVAVLFEGYSPWEFASKKGLCASEGEALYRDAKEALKEKLS